MSVNLMLTQDDDVIIMYRTVSQNVQYGTVVSYLQRKCLLNVAVTYSNLLYSKILVSCYSTLMMKCSLSSSSP